MIYNVLSMLFWDSWDDISEFFNIFEVNCVIIFCCLGVGNYQDENFSVLGYIWGYGNIQQEVILFVFIVVYWDVDFNSVWLNIFD